MTIRYCDKQSSRDATKPCPHVALAGTSQCLEHRELGAVVQLQPLTPLTRQDWLLAEQPDRETVALPPVPTLPAPSPWAEGERMLDRLGQILDHADFAAAHDSVRPELAAAIRAAADEDSTGVTVLSLDDIAARGRAAFRRFLDAEITKAEGDHCTISPSYEPLGMDPLAHLCRQFDGVGLDASTAPPPLRAPEVTLDDLVETLQRIETVAPPNPIKLTVEQLAIVRRNAAPRAPWEPDPTIWGVPVEIVDLVEDSTPYRWRPVQPVELVPPRPPLPPVEELMDSAMQRMLLPPRTFPHPARATPAELHRDVVLAEATAEPVIKRRPPAGKRRSIVGRIWRRLRRWAR
ncbi:hypothetical protein ACFWIW_10855 [Amycolatopsis sp. NPDC058340]|uniref:hypothetical protein n=1 Tax=Amycolatopsis sp. NPDC058340 TaxID=3346453 RepID=UPI003654F57A